MRGTAPRILHVVTTTDHRGAEVFAVGLAAALETLGRHGDVMALAPGTSPTRLPIATLGTRRLAPSTLRRLRARVRHARVVVAHGSTTLPAAAVATAGTGVPFVYRSIGDPAFWSTRIDRRAWVRVALHRAAAVVSLWDAAGAELVRRHGVVPERMRVIPNGVPGARLLAVTSADRGQARLALGLPAEGPVVAYVGALSGEKDLGSAIRAIGAIEGVRLVVAGDGPDEAALRAEAERAAPGRVHFLGSLDDVVPVYAAADALVLPSRTEGLPAAPIEAGLAGVPVVASAVGGIPEIVVDGVTGVLVSPGDVGALARGLRTAIAAAAQMGPAARSRCAERFELGAVAASWAQLLDAVADPGGVWPPAA